MQNQEPNLPHWVRDLQSYIDSIPFGEVDLQIKRVDRKTVEIKTVAKETLRYVDNQEALRDMDKLLTNLIESKFSGDAHLQIEMKDGNITLLGVFNTKHSKY